MNLLPILALTVAACIAWAGAVHRLGRRRDDFDRHTDQALDLCVEDDFSLWESQMRVVR